MENKIVIDNLSKSYGKTQALKDVSLVIKQGMYGLLGENGAGKTTLMKILTTLLKADSGNVTVCGTELKEAQRIREITGYLPQEFSIYSNMTVFDSMDYIGVLSGLNKNERRERTLELLRKVNLKKNINTKIKALSGGMKRRLGIAQAILHNPKVVIVDEPTVGLDPEERIRVRNLLSDMSEDRIVMLSTHIVEDIEATCENIAILSEGQILYDGTVTNILEEAREHIYSAKVDNNELKIINKKYFITSKKTTGKDVYIRFIMDSKEPKIMLKDIKKVEPNVEDAYMYVRHKGEGD